MCLDSNNQWCSEDKLVLHSAEVKQQAEALKKAAKEAAEEADKGPPKVARESWECWVWLVCCQGSVRVWGWLGKVQGQSASSSHTASVCHGCLP